MDDLPVDRGDMLLIAEPGGRQGSTVNIHFDALERDFAESNERKDG